MSGGAFLAFWLTVGLLGFFLLMVALTAFLGAAANA